MLIGVGLAVSHFISRFWDLVVTIAGVWLLNPDCGTHGASGIDAGVFHSVLGVILPFQISLSSIVLTTGISVVDGATCFQESR